MDPNVSPQPTQADTPVTQPSLQPIGKIPSPKNKWKLILFIIILLIIIFGGGAYYLGVTQKDALENQKEKTVRETQSSQKSDPQPTTSKEKKSANDTKKNVLVIVDENYYAGLSPYLSEFKSDVKSKFGVDITALSINPNIYTSEKIRELLISECRIDSKLGCKDLEGAIFVGDIPYAIYDSPYDLTPAPFMFYYQDLDATFNKKSNGNYDKYLTFGAHEGPEIYISWIKPIKDPTFGNYQEQLNNFFIKHHKYLLGETKATKKVLLATHCDIASAGSWSFIFENYYNKENIIEVYPKGRCDNICPLKKDLLTQLSAMPEVTRLHSHGTPTELWCLSKEDIKSLESQPALMASWGCSAGNFHNYESDSFPLAFINGKDIGLSFIGKLHSEDIDTSGEGINFVNNDIYLFENWNKGDYIGKAFLDMEQSFTNKTFPPGDEKHPASFTVNLYRVSGPLQRIIIGSPFVYQQTVSPAERRRAEAITPTEDPIPRAPAPNN